MFDFSALGQINDMMPRIQKFLDGMIELSLQIRDEQIAQRKILDELKSKLLEKENV